MWPPARAATEHMQVTDSLLSNSHERYGDRVKPHAPGAQNFFDAVRRSSPQIISMTSNKITLFDQKRTKDQLSLHPSLILQLECSVRLNVPPVQLWTGHRLASIIAYLHRRDNQRDCSDDSALWQLISVAVQTIRLPNVYSDLSCRKYRLLSANAHQDDRRVS